MSEGHGHHHGNSHSHGHHHHHHFDSTSKLYWAVFINVLLTVLQIVGGVFSGSLSLIADAMHNLSDAGALAIAAIAAKIAKIPANSTMTYGYRRAEILGALINSTTLAVVGVYLLYEAVVRYFDQQPIDGWIVIYIAGFALVIDLLTALLTFAGAKESINIKAAFIHNVSDAAASVVVIISGILIIVYELYFVDLIATVLISGYVLYHSFFMLKQCVLILMQSAPPNLQISSIKQTLEKIQHVKEVHHLHVWQLDDTKVLLEGHLVIDSNQMQQLEAIKKQVREQLKTVYSIEHSTLEIETAESCPVL